MGMSSVLDQGPGSCPPNLCPYREWLLGAIAGNWHPDPTASIIACRDKHTILKADEALQQY